MQLLGKRWSQNLQSGSSLAGAILAAIWLLATTYFTLFGHAVRTGPGAATAADVQRQLKLGEASADSLYAVTVSVKDPARLQGTDSIHVAVADASGPVAEKWLHTADLDFYLTVRPRVRGPVTATLRATSESLLSNVAVAFNPVPLGNRIRPATLHDRPGSERESASETAVNQQGQRAGAASEPAVIAAQPNSTWEAAQPFEWGQTIYGSADERPYAPSSKEDGYAAMVKGFQWFKFTFHGQQPRLAYFVLNITDRDVPLDVDIFKSGAYQGKADVVPYRTGEFIYQIEATQNYPGLYKFRTRLLKPGETYYVRVHANHPAWQLHTYDYPVPPYADPRQAVRTGMDFLVNMGDTWLSNTPRRGSVALRTSMQHSETHLCIACHPTQFTTRGYLTAIQNGYPPTQRAALEFLTDRIYNNARPLYGEPNTNWVRVIYSARTVASRLPVIEHLYETNVSHDPPRPGFGLAYGDFLKIHYKNAKEMPGDETDGCEPEVSPFEIAAQSWDTFNLLHQQTHDPQWLEQRDNVLRLALPYKPKNMIDLNWKIHFLAAVGREKFAKELDELIAQLYSYETPEGLWAYPFDKNAKPADFISYHAVLALALAGRRPESDPNMARALHVMLKAQRPEGSWEGDPVYQGFNTPFRATQFAVMALSTLYPGPDKKPSKDKGWNDAFPAPPTHLSTSNLPRLLWQLDQYWDLAPEPVLKQIRQVLATSKQPLAREAAARALGHMADPGSIDVLGKALGDQSKMVQTSAAYALRMILSRRTKIAAQGRTVLAAALQSPDARTRWGATRLFGQHFKDLTGDPTLLAALSRDVNDPVPFVRFQASSGLWRWYYWQVDHREARNKGLEALASRLNTETDPMVRRGLEESIYDVLDENTGYMAAWIKTAGTREDKDHIGSGYEGVVRDQAQVLAKVLRSGTELGREGILNALWDFHVRHYALPQVKSDTVSIGLPAVLTRYVEGVPDLHRPGYDYPPYRETVSFKYDVHNGFFQTRIGNDSDLIHFFRSSGPQLEQALVACLEGADDNMKIQVLKAGSTLSGAGDEKFALAALQLSLDPDKEVRETVRYVYENGQRGILNIDTPAPDPKLVKTVVEILNQGNPDSQSVVLPLLASLPGDSPWERQTEVLASVRALLERQPRPQNYAQVLNAASSFDSLMHDPKLRDQALAALNDNNREVQRAAMQIALERFLDNPATKPLVEKAFASLDSPQRLILIEEVNDPKFARRHAGVSGGALSQDQQYFLGNDYKYKEPDFLAAPAVVSAVMSSLNDRDANVRAAALDLLRKVNGVEQRPEFRAALDKLRKDPNPRLQLIADNVLGGKKLSEALSDVKPGSVLDFNFFVSKVEPILATPGADGKACVMCHANHVIFKLRPPNTEGVFSAQDSEENYKHAMRVVDIGNPQHSLILIKPTRPTDAGADVSDYYATHNGGQRWPGNQSSTQYKTILEWIRGARMETASNRVGAQ
jgi:HEAT repeat protein